VYGFISAATEEWRNQREIVFYCHIGALSVQIHAFSGNGFLLEWPIYILGLLAGINRDELSKRSNLPVRTVDQPLLACAEVSGKVLLVNGGI